MCWPPFSPQIYAKILREGELNNCIQKDMKEFFRCETIELMKLLLERCCEVIPSLYQIIGTKEINHQRKKSKIYICNHTQQIKHMQYMLYEILWGLRFVGQQIVVPRVSSFQMHLDLPQLISEKTYFDLFLPLPHVKFFVNFISLQFMLSQVGHWII